MQAKNPVTGDNVDASNPRTWISYAVGGTMLVAGLMAGKFVTDTASEATGAGESVSETVLSLS